MRAAFVLVTVFVVGCGPSPAMQSRAPARATASSAPSTVVVVACDCDDDDEPMIVAPPAKPVEYVRIDEWQPPPSVRELESRIEPRGNKPPDYVRLPNLTLHREIAPTTTWRHGRYWY